MLAASLLDAVVQAGARGDTHEELVSQLNSIGVPHANYELEQVKTCGIAAWQLHVYIDGVEEGAPAHEGDCIHGTHAHVGNSVHVGSHDHAHTSLSDIKEVVTSLNLSAKVKQDILSVYEIIAQAESLAHGVEVNQIHFHEVGQLDAIADIAASCYLMEQLSPQSVIASALNLGAGSVKCAHGLMPVPAPAVAQIVKGVPTYGVSKNIGELCTPTGAALLKYFVHSWGAQPAMLTSAVGLGAGKKQFEFPNVVRAFVGELVSSDVCEQVEKSSAQDLNGATDMVVKLEFNTDDMTAEALAFATEELFEAGALDVWSASIHMKKCRLGVLTSVLTTPDNKEAIVRTIFKHTTTLGVREEIHKRYILGRQEIVCDLGAKLGSVQIKRSSGYGVQREKAEYEDLARVARVADVSLATARVMVGKQTAGAIAPSAKTVESTIKNKDAEGGASDE
jgi:hypothetical protein